MLYILMFHTVMVKLEMNSVCIIDIFLYEQVQVPYIVTALNKMLFGILHLLHKYLTMLLVTYLIVL